MTSLAHTCDQSPSEAAVVHGLERAAALCVGLAATTWLVARRD